MKKLFSILWESSLAISLLFAACAKNAKSVTGTTPQDSTTTSKPDTTAKSDTVATPKSWVVSTIAGSGMQGYSDGDSTQAEFNNPQDIAIDLQGNLLIGDDGPSSRIRMISPSHKVTTFASDTLGYVANPLFDNVYGLVVDSKGDVFDNEENYIREFTPGGANRFFAGSLLVSYKDDTGTAAHFNITMHMAIDRRDNIFLPDYDMSNIHHLREVTPAGVVTTLQIQDNTGISDNSNGSIWYDYPIAVDSADNLYVASGMGTLIKKVTPQGNVSIFAGSIIGGVQDGVGSQAGFGHIADMTCDAAGNLWVLDNFGVSIRKVTPNGAVSTIVGPGAMGYADGPAATAQFKYPSGIAVAKDGSIYVVDNGNFRIRKITPQY
jgi:serine/threonine-protein kinase